MAGLVASLRRARPASVGMEWLLTAERGRFALWLPVFLGVGVALYFAALSEPPPWAGAAVAGPALAGCALAARLPLLRAGLALLAAGALGFAAAQFASARAPELLDLPRTAVVLTGTVSAVEILADARRITLDQARLGPDAPMLPRRVRVRLRATDHTELEPGQTVRIRALLRPPAPPAYPGAWDLQRDAFFSGLGAGGTALGAADVVAPAAPGGAGRFLQGLREGIQARILAVLPGADGAIAATLLTGLASAIPRADRAAFSESGLAHLLAVAGLHIGIVMGLILGATRLLLACSERASLYWPCKQIAALAALAAGFGYLLLTGAHVPIIRSFAMAALFTTGVLAGRRAVSLRGLALAAAVLLFAAPNELLGVSFQMSFSAVLALIAGYDLARPHLTALYGSGTWRRRFIVHVAALALTSFLAGTASAPFAAYHFGKIQLYYVLSNLVAVPITAFWVMPWGLLSLELMPLGIETGALIPMGWGTHAILWIARSTAALPAATLAVPHMPEWGLALTALGMAWLGLWRSRLRLAGLPVLALGLVSPLLARPPDMLVSPDARVIALHTAEGLFTQTTQGASAFVVDAFRQYYGETEDTPFPPIGDDAGIRCTEHACRLSGRAATALLLRGEETPDCAGIAIVVSAEPARGKCPSDVRLVDRFTVWRDGSQAIWLDVAGARVLSDRAARGDRPWVPAPPHPRADPALPMAEAE